MRTKSSKYHLEDSQVESYAIHRTPADLEVGTYVDTYERGRVGTYDLGFPCVFARRGRKGVDDRLFLEALHFFTVENVSWRALPDRFGHWNSVWKRFNRLSRAGVFEAMFDTLASMSSSAHLVQMFDSTSVRAHVSAAGAKGGSKARRLVDPKADLAPKSHSQLKWQNQTNVET